MQLAEIRDDNGLLPTYAWPGGYPVFYLAADNGILCPDCANGENGSECCGELDADCPSDDQWIIVAHDIHWEGEPIVCEHCDAQIQSAYGSVT